MQMPIFLLFVSAGNLFDGAFSVWVSLSSISAHNYVKIFVLKVFIAIHKFGIICLSETCLDSKISSDDNNL